MNLYLAIDYPGICMEREVMKGQSVTVGRSSKCDIQILNPSVSSIHCEIVDTADGWMVRDLHSTNGTFVNGRRVGDGEVIKDGDEIKVGNVTIRVRMIEGMLRSEAATEVAAEPVTEELEEEEGPEEILEVEDEEEDVLS